MGTYYSMNTMRNGILQTKELKIAVYQVHDIPRGPLEPHGTSDGLPMMAMESHGVSWGPMAIAIVSPWGPRETHGISLGTPWDSVRSPELCGGRQVLRTSRLFRFLNNI